MQIIRKEVHIYHYISYSLLYVIIGIIINCIGPIIPYLAKESNRLET